MKRKTNTRIVHETPVIPDQNILDLRSGVQPRRETLTRRDVLDHFWTARETVRKPKRRKLDFRTSRSTDWTRVLLLIRNIRVGSFPIVASSALVLFGVVMMLGQALSVQARVTSMAEDGYASLREAGSKTAARNLTDAATSFHDAAAQFSDAEQAFQDMHPAVTAVLSRLPVTGPKLRSAGHLLSAARLLSHAGEQFSTLAIPLAQSDAGLAGTARLIERIENDQENFNGVIANLRTAVDELAAVQPKQVPEQFRQTIEELQSVIPGLRSTLGNLATETDILASFLGVRQPADFLFLFQNSNELRPAGGFIGSFALLHMAQGQFHILDAPDKGSFGVDDAMPSTITPPLPLQVITPSWYFRDANWYPDFPASSRQLVRFYTQARGFRPSGVVAITQVLIERLLTVTGPIEIPQYGVTVDSSNFTSITQEQVQRRYDLRVNDPKRFIVDLLPVLTEKLSSLDLGQYPKLLAAIGSSVESGDLQIWSDDASTEQQIENVGWSGRMPTAPGDFLGIVDANIGGEKTDGVITESIAHDVTVQPDGSVIATVRVTLHHTGTVDDPFSGSMNRTYHRVYVPEGSSFISAEGFTQMPRSAFRQLPSDSADDTFFRNIEGRVTIDEQSGTRMNNEFGKTVFGNWTEINPGETQTFSVTYTLPFMLSGTLERYDLTLFHQAGSRNRSVSLTIHTQDSTDIAWLSLGTIPKKGKPVVTTELDTTKMVSVVLQRS